ncbi:uncharacterized protein C1orf87 homolog isoform X1 [Monodelphis domestica]|uniref:EF-hand domain-containing protein n=1 Tax=Monodelphis domestica TaxID=13616 RepID=F7BVM2_MONDO|nr:uncharacterized protein C1orf87 homolog isoform X1 [Monodelphis domestica]
MSSSWDTPYRRAAMPETVVKIIGSKHYRFLVEKPKMQVKENITAKAQPDLGPLVPRHGRQLGENPLALNSFAEPKVKFNPDFREQNKVGNKEDKSISIGAGNSSRLLGSGMLKWADAQCSSVPSGDQSLSFLHGLPKPSPIDWSLEHMSRNGPCGLESLGLRSSEDESLLAMVGREFKVHPPGPNLLEMLEKELKVLDPISSGLLLQSQLSRLLIKHELPLQLPTVKLLFQRFTQTRYSELVNYKKLLWFLRLAVSRETQRSDPPADDIPGKKENSNNLGPSSSSEATDNIIELLRSALKTSKDELNLENLHLSFQKEDQPFSGHLPPSKIKPICEKHGLILSPSLMEAMASHQDLNIQDEIKWQKLMEFLVKASSDGSSSLPQPSGTEKEEVPFSVAATKGSEAVQSLTEDLKQTEDGEPPPANPALETRASRQIRPASQPYLSQLGNEETQRETWMDRFRKLENALYLCDVNHTGVLEKERARRLMHNYNLIYNLALSPLKIDQAVRRFRVGENLLLEPTLRYLKEL